MAETGLGGGFFGGIASGIDAFRAEELKKQQIGLQERGLGLQERQLQQQGELDRQRIGLEERGLGLRERAQKFSERTLLVTEADNAIAKSMEAVSEMIKAGLAANRSPDEIRSGISGMVASAERTARNFGRNAEAIRNQVEAMLAQPGAVETARATGTAKAVQSQSAVAAGGTVLAPEKAVEVENKLRDDYLKQSGPFVTVRDAWARIQSIDDSAAGDIALLYSYIKVLDPGSTVREGELALTQQAQGVPERVRVLYNNAVKGEQLSNELRQGIRSQADKLYKAQAEQHENIRNQFMDISKRSGVNPKNVAIDFTPVTKPKGESGKADPLGIR